ncbi:MAG: multidrug effflux MFS transporter, partial [Sphingomonadales bacterium]|nr:multidrug effflux MFS transporter [Sphingomonadales bacterium]
MPPPDPKAGGSEKLPLGQVILLAALTATLPASLDGLSPALPAIAQGLSTDAAHVSAAISAFVILFALAQLAGGMLADALGRRPVVLGGLVIYVAGSIGAAYAPNFELLLVARAFQGLGTAAAVMLARTIVLDQLPREAAAQALALIGIFFSLTPIIVPLVRGALVALAGWRAPLLAMGALGVVVGIASLYRLPETLARHDRLPFDPGALLRSLAHLARSRPLMAYVLANAFAYSGILLFSAAAAQVIIGHMGVEVGIYALLFSLSTAGFMAGNAVSYRLVRRRGLDGTLRAGLLFLGLGPLLMILASQAWPQAWAALILPQILYSLGWGIVQPQAQAGALSTHPESIGQCSSLLGFVQLAIGGAIVAVFSRVTAGTSLALALGMAFCGFTALLV